MKLSISNIAWESCYDDEIYEFLREYNFDGIEIAPARIFGAEPYENCGAVSRWADRLKREYLLEVSSMQSILFGHKEKLFRSEADREILFETLKKAVLFAEAAGCPNLVFGSPANRVRFSEKDNSVAVSFFREIGGFAFRHHTILAFEANPEIYHTDFINRTDEAFSLVREVNSPGFKVNLDLGTILYNQELLEDVCAGIGLINHVHISEPGLKCVIFRDIHRHLSSLLRQHNYKGYVSIEMEKQSDINEIKRLLAELKQFFG